MSMARNRLHPETGEILDQLQQPAYLDGRTVQSFKDETDINRIMDRARVTGTISHLSRYEARYGDFADFDFLDAQVKLNQGREIFDALPAELRKEFGQSPAEFFSFINNPDNVERREKIMRTLAQPGRQLLDVSGKNAPPGAQGSVATETTTTDGPAASAVPDSPESQES